MQDFNVQCDHCSKISFDVTYYLCRECGIIICENCASKGGGILTQKSMREDDKWYVFLGKLIIGAFRRACPECLSENLMVLHKPEK